MDQDGVVGSWIGDPGPSPTVTQLAVEEQPWALKANFDVSPIPKREISPARKRIVLARGEGVPNDETCGCNAIDVPVSVSGSIGGVQQTVTVMADLQARRDARAECAKFVELQAKEKVWILGLALRSEPCARLPILPTGPSAPICSMSPRGVPSP